MKLTIGHLYPELLNLYGDRGNIICMVQRLKWRGIDAEVKEFDFNDKIDFSKLDCLAAARTENNCLYAIA